MLRRVRAGERRAFQYTVNAGNGVLHNHAVFAHEHQFGERQRDDRRDDDVKQQIQQEKEEAIRDIRRQVAVLSVDIAEKIIRRNLDEKHEQMEMIDRMLDEMLAANH